MEFRPREFIDYYLLGFAAKYTRTRLTDAERELLAMTERREHQLTEMLAFPELRSVCNYQVYKSVLDDCRVDGFELSHRIVSVLFTRALITTNTHYRPRRDDIIKRWFCRYYASPAAVAKT